MSYTTFCEKLDELFGGYVTRRLLHVYGDAKTGKTTLSFYLPVISIIKSEPQLLQKYRKPIFILVSCDAGYEESRLEELCEVHGVDYSKLEKVSSRN